MIKNVLKNINANKLGASIFMIAMFISIFCLIIGINTFINQYKYTHERNKFADENINVTISFNDKSNYVNIINLSKELSEDKYTIFLPKVQLVLDDKMAFVTGIISNDIEFNLVKGRNFSHEELISDCNKIIIASGYEEKIYLKENKEFIKVFDEEYEVIGIVGEKYSESFYDGNMYIPYKGLPKHIKNLSSDIAQIQINNKNIEKKEYLNKKYNILNMDIENINKITLDSRLEKHKEYFDYLKYMSIFVLSNIFLLITSWMNSRKYQIAIKKVVGYDNLKIIKELILEMSILTIISSIISTIIYKLTSTYISKFLYITLYLSPINFFVSTFIALTISVLISLCQIFIISKSNINSFIQS